MLRTKVVFVPAVLALAMAIALILAAGPFLQDAMMGVLNGNSLSIYEAVHGTKIVQFPSLMNWLADALRPSYLLIGIVSAVCAVAARSPREMFTRVALSAFCGLELNDFIWSLTYGSIALEPLVEATVANLLGAAVLSILCVSGAEIAERVASAMTSVTLFGIFVGSSTLLLLGLLFTSALFYIGDFFFRPLPVRIDASIGAPLNAAFATRDEHISQDNHAFKLFPSRLDAPLITWSDPDSNISGDWQALSPGTKFAATIEILSGCLESTWVDEKIAPNAPYQAEDVKHISISFDKGASDFWLFDSDRGPAVLNLETVPASPFGIEKATTPDKLRLWQFIGDESKLVYRGSDDKLSFYIGKKILSSNDDVIETVPTSVRLEIDDKHYDISLVPLKPKPNDTIACKSLPTRKAVIGGATTLPGSALNVGIRITIDAEDLDGTIRKETSSLTTTGSSGWITLDGVDKQDFENADGGILSMFEAQGEVRLDVNGVAQTVRPIDRFIAEGIFGSLNYEDGRIRLYGTADALTKDLVRQNPTKFETAQILDLLTLVMPVAVLIGGLLMPFRRRLNSNVPFTWFV
ncbi:hypothetical protein [Rhizobium sullae]|nr:hypothetical protein [Rhizobium sullae]